MKIGVLGVGNLAAYLVQGAQKGGHHFVLSPRGASKAADLAARVAALAVGQVGAVVQDREALARAIAAAQGA